MADRSVLEIAQAVADVVGIGEIPSMVNNREASARAMRRLIDRAGRDMSRMRNPWGAGWTVQTREYLITTQSGVDEYALPEDFEALIDGTLWDRSTYREMRGTLSPQEWQQARSGLIQTVAIAPLYRVRRSSTGNTRALFLEPVPAEEETLVLEYVSKGWLRSARSEGAFIDRIESDSDEPIFDDDLMEMSAVWRFRQSRGLSYALELAEFEMARDRIFGADAGPRTIVVGMGRRGNRWPNVPEGNWPGGIG